MPSLLLLLLAGLASAGTFPRGCPAGTHHWTPRGLAGSTRMTMRWVEVQPRMAREAIQCKPCAAGAVSVKATDGFNYCVGGKSARPGVGTVFKGEAIQPYMMMPCAEGQVSISINGESVCVPADACPADRAPIPIPGPVRRLECVPPMDPKARLDLSPTPPARVPVCAAGEGLSISPDMSFSCVPCRQGPVFRNGRPVCGRNPEMRCPPRQGAVIHPVGNSPIACAPCPDDRPAKPHPELGVPSCE